MTDREVTIINWIACEGLERGEWGVEKDKGNWTVSRLFDLNEECSDMCPDRFIWVYLDEYYAAIMERQLDYVGVTLDKKYRATHGEVVLIFNLSQL